MATAIQIAQFIEEVAECARNAYRQLGKVKPSVCIAMACVESAYGTSSIMRKNNAFLGQKVGTGKTAKIFWGGKFFVARTSEEYTVGTHTIIKDAFRSYNSMQQCILNYYELLNTSLYGRVREEADYETQMKQIKQVGYMTSSTEVNSVLTLIKKYNLTKYDDLAYENPDKGKNPYHLYSTIMKVGSTGESVKWLQFELNKRGASLIIDGKYGAKTKSAVIKYQMSVDHLITDGVVGKETLAALNG